MTTELHRFADVELLVITALRAATGVRAVTDLPADLLDVMPIFRVAAVGGSDDRVTDTSHVQVEAFAGTRPDARDLAEVARTALLALAHTAVSGWLIDVVETESRPMWVTYQNDHVDRFIATYGIATRVRG